MTQEDGFAELYRLHYRRVYGFCRQLLGEPAGAADAAQEVFLRAASRATTKACRSARGS